MKKPPIETKNSKVNKPTNKVNQSVVRTSTSSTPRYQHVLGVLMIGASCFASYKLINLASTRKRELESFINSRNQGMAAEPDKLTGFYDSAEAAAKVQFEMYETARLEWSKLMLNYSDKYKSTLDSRVMELDTWIGRYLVYVIALNGGWNDDKVFNAYEAKYGPFNFFQNQATRARICANKASQQPCWGKFNGMFVPQDHNTKVRTEVVKDVQDLTRDVYQTILKAKPILVQ